MPSIPLPHLPAITVTSVIDVLAVAVLVYQLVLALRGRRAAQILGGVCALTAAYFIAVWAQLNLLRTVLAALAPYLPFALIVMFQSEIRRMLARIGHVHWLGLGGRLERREVAEEIVLAVEHMSEVKVGALIVIERDIGLRTFVESGVPLDALVSRDLLCSIFEPKGALHDGAVILQKDRVVAGACFLPLATHHLAHRTMATRHRAAVGVTEETDALAIVVSEASGKIAVALRGDIESDVSLDRLREMVTHHGLGRSRRVGLGAEPRWKQAGT